MNHYIDAENSSFAPTQHLRRAGQRFVRAVAASLTCSARRKSRARNHQGIAGLLAALMLLFFTNTAFADIETTTATVNGQTSINAVTGGTISVLVSVSTSDGTDYDSTSYSWNNSGGPYTCINTDNNNNGGSE